jgi:predicted KAP-like P-loop ATPase
VDGDAKEAGQMTYKDKSMWRAWADAPPPSWFPVLRPEIDIFTALGRMDNTLMMSDVITNIDDSVSKAVGSSKSDLLCLRKRGATTAYSSLSQAVLLCNDLGAVVMGEIRLRTLST